MPGPRASPDEAAAPPAGPGSLREAPIGQTFAAIAATCVTEVLATAGEVERIGDSEALHQLRVAIRRTRAALSVFRAGSAGHRPLPLARGLRRLQRRLGATREWDVFVDETLPSLPPEFRDQPATQALAKLAAGKREEGRAAMRAALRDPTNVATLRRLAALPGRPFARQARWDAEMLAQPARNVATAILEVRDHKARRLGRKLRKLDTLALHRLRIRIKKLRYAAEFLCGSWPGKRTRRYLASLRDLQQALGSWHDAAVAQALVAHLAAVPPVAEWLATQEQQRRREVEDAWRDFARRRRFWDA